MRIAFIDHYDSFSFNVLDWLIRSYAQYSHQQLEIIHIFADDEKRLAKLKITPVPTVISPGPGAPNDYPHTLTTIQGIRLSTPILGVCLGHQIIGQIFGGSITKAQAPWHGTISQIKTLNKNWLTDGLSDSFQVISYNSLICTLPNTSDSELLVSAQNPLGEAMIFAHRQLPIASVQFHPESYGSENLNILAQNFFKFCKRTVCLIGK